MLRFAAGRAARDSPAEYSLQAFDEILVAERTPRVLCSPERGERSIVAGVGDQCGKVGNTIEQRLDDCKPVIAAIKMGADA
jgi:hypothetical protein